MLSLIAGTVALALQAETGAVRYASGGDDTYVEQQYPNNMRMTSAAYGLAVRGSVDNVELSIGWRSLGQESINADIITDADYWACGGGGAPKGYKATSHHCTEAPIAWWHSEGSVSQLYAELGYAFHVGSVSLVPSVGVGRTDLSWHLTDYAIVGPNCGKHAVYTRPDEVRAEPFAGVTARYHAIGVGVFVLSTASQQYGTAITPGEGSYATYLRVTYTVGSN